MICICYSDFFPAICYFKNDNYIYFYRYNVIANPLEGKLTKIKAFFIIFLLWCYTIPWAIFPLFQIWGRFVPGIYVN